MSFGGEYDESFMDTWLESNTHIIVGPASLEDWMPRFQVTVAADEDGSYVPACRQWCAASPHCIGFYNKGSDCWIYDPKLTSAPEGAAAYYGGARTPYQWVDRSSAITGDWVYCGMDFTTPESVSLIYISFLTLFIHCFYVISLSCNMHFAADTGAKSSRCTRLGEKPGWSSTLRPRLD